MGFGVAKILSESEGGGGVRGAVVDEGKGVEVGILDDRWTLGGVVGGCGGGVEEECSGISLIGDSWRFC